MTSAPRAKYSKYKHPGDAPNVAITNDDDQILLEVYRHDIIDANTIYTLLAPRPIDKLRRRLRKLHLEGRLLDPAEIGERYRPLFRDATDNSKLSLPSMLDLVDPDAPDLPADKRKRPRRQKKAKKPKAKKTKKARTKKPGRSLLRRSKKK